MNRSVRQAVLRILQLLEDFSPEDLAAAVSAIDGEKEEDLLSFLSRAALPSRRSSPSPGGTGIRKEGETRALQELKPAGGEKYELLRALETEIREGGVLKTLDEFRAFGKALDKDFTPGQSRKAALGRLMMILARMDLSSIQSAIAKIPRRTGEEEQAFRRLANHIISGQSSRTPDAEHK